MSELRQRYLKTAVVAIFGLSIAIIAAMLLDQFATAFVAVRTSENKIGPESVEVSALDRAKPLSAMPVHDAPRPVPIVGFADAAGKPVTLTDFRGKLVLLNIWATWCGPCRREMPTLDRLQAKLGGSTFEVVALSIDRAGIRVVDAFYAEIGIEHLARYIDESGASARTLNAVGLPTTLLIDGEGHEVARHVGSAEWDTPEMIAFFRQFLNRGTGARSAGRPYDRVRMPGRRPSTMPKSDRGFRLSGLDLPAAGNSTAVMKGTVR